MRIGIHGLISLLVLGSSMVMASGTVAEEASYSAERAYREFIELAEAAQRHAITPPTRQEMLFRGISATLVRNTQRPPEDLAKQISNAGSQQEEQRILAECFKNGLKWSERVHAQFLASSVNWIPGGATLTPIPSLKITRQLRDNLYVGIGIQIAKGEHYCTMPRVLPHGPARKAMAQPNDKIRAVDGVDVRGAELTDVVDRLRGPRGSKVVVELQTGNQPPRTVTMTRDIIPIDSVEGVRRKPNDEWSFELSADPTVAFLRIKEIKSSTVPEMRVAARHIKRLGARALVLDLTQCSQGDFRYAVMLADALLGDASLGAKRTRSGDTKFRSSGEMVLRGTPIAVLISGRTTGPGEYLAAALRDNKRATLLGDATAGVGAIPVEVDLQSGFALRVIGGQMIRPNGKSLDQTRSRIKTPGTAEFERFLLNSHNRKAPTRGVQPHRRVGGSPMQLIEAALEVFKAEPEKSDSAP